MSRVRALVVVPCFALGAAVSLGTVALHDYAWGLLLGVVTTAATMVALPPGWWSRLAFALGWVALLAFAVSPRPEGDYLVSSDPDGYLLLVAGMVVFVAGFVGVVRRRATPDDSGATGAAP